MADPQVTGADRVDIVAHSQGGLIGRYFVKNLGGDAAVDSLVSLAAPHYGTRAANVADVLGFGSCAGIVACEQMAVGSTFLTQLNEGDDTIGDVVYTNIVTRFDEVVVPYTNGQIGLDEAWKAGVAPIRRFMSMQIERTNNAEDIWMFLEYLPDSSAAKDYQYYDDVPLEALLPAFMLSELKTAFLIGFQIYLPFLILDMVIASVLISMGMLMLPPVLISLPFKLLLFVLVDGWRFVVEMLLESFHLVL